MVLGDPRLDAEEEGEIFAVDGEPFEMAMGPGESDFSISQNFIHLFYILLHKIEELK